MRIKVGVSTPRRGVASIAEGSSEASVGCEQAVHQLRATNRHETARSKMYEIKSPLQPAATQPKGRFHVAFQNAHIHRSRLHVQQSRRSHARPRRHVWRRTHVPAAAAQSGRGLASHRMCARTTLMRRALWTNARACFCSHSPSLTRVNHAQFFSTFLSPVKKTMKAYSDVFLGNDKDLSGGDKIILHASVLEDLSTFSMAHVS